MFNRNSLVVLLSISILFVIGCDDDDSAGPSQDTDVDAQFSTVVTFIDLDGFRINILGKEAPYVGYNNFKIEVRDKQTDALITPDSWQFLPTMDMGTHLHSAPRLVVDDSKFDIVFVMPSMLDNKWNLALNITIDGKEYSPNFPLEVKQADYCKMVTDPALTEAGTYALALKKADWQIGMNDVEFMLYMRKSHMQFQPVSIASFTMEPDMPSMGHGSNNNVTPVAGEMPGQFNGAVNFTMSGRWRVTVGIEVPTLNEQSARIESIEMFVQVP